MKYNFEKIDFRYRNIVVGIVILLVILGIRLFILTVPQHQKWSKLATEQNTKILFTPAPRGDIYDRNGNLLASNKQIFNITFNASSLDTKEINESSLLVINKLIENGDKFKDNFPIVINNGEYSYTYNHEQSQWLREHGFEPNATAAQVLEYYRGKYGINKNLDRYEALKEIETKYHLSLPISPKKMIFIYQANLEEFWKKFGFNEDEIEKGISAKKCFQELRKKYSVSKNLSDEEARKIFIVRNDIATNGFTKYVPIMIGTNISKQSVIYFEENHIPGVSVVSSYERTYPNGSLAAHILGYMGAISQSESKEYVRDKGYLPTDLVGKDGIEAAFEEKLHGKPGIKRIRVDSTGQYKETISNSNAKKGKDIYLTIDQRLQKTAEEALASNISKARYARSGAVVAMDVKTGEILAMASYPTFDLNMFADGISTEEWKSVQPENPRDNMSPAPLFNNATMLSVAPGSTFKPITAFAALEAGLNPNRYIYDKGYIKLGGRTFGCDAWNSGGGSHGSENLTSGIGNSCNYYFYCISTNKDWGSGASLGYSKKIDADSILEKAKEFGLGSKTGIEIGETVRPMASAKTKMENYKIGLWGALYDRSHEIFPKEVYSNQEKLNKNLNTITSWMEENPSYDKVIQLLKEKTDVKKSEVDDVAAIAKFDYFNLASWTTADIFNISIGQGDNAYTPIQMARYVSTIANKGHLKKATLLYKVEGEGNKKQDEGKQVNFTESQWESVVRGMRYVCTNGTLAGTFANYPIAVAGKSGTAEYQGIRQPKDEVEYVKERLSYFNSMAGTNISWDQVEKEMRNLMVKKPEKYPTESDAVDSALINVSEHKITYNMINKGKGTYKDFGWAVTFAPVDDPEIAVVSMLPEGIYGSYAAPINRAVIDQYFKLKDKNKQDPKNKN